MTFASTSSLNREQNRNPNASTLSLITKTTDIESVGTFLPQLPESLLEDQSMTAIINQYFGESKPKRAPLPIKDYETRILQSIRANRVVIIEGATGCGKTTQVPQFIADDCASMGLPFNIVVTQPRRIAAKSIAARVAEERSWSLGTIVGYQIGLQLFFQLI
jgi:HrpA-like RNA helicase